MIASMKSLFSLLLLTNLIMGSADAQGFTKVIDVGLSKKTVNVDGTVGKHQFTLHFIPDDMIDSRSIRMNITFGGRYYDLYDAAHGEAMNQFVSSKWSEGDEYEWQQNEWTGSEYPFNVKLKLDKILQKDTKGNYARMQFSVWVTERKIKGTEAIPRQEVLLGENYPYTLYSDNFKDDINTNLSYFAGDYQYYEGGDYGFCFIFIKIKGNVVTAQQAEYGNSPRALEHPRIVGAKFETTTIKGRFVKGSFEFPEYGKSGRPMVQKVRLQGLLIDEKVFYEKLK